MKKLPKFTCCVSDCADNRHCQRRRVIVRPCGRSNPALGDLTPAPFKFKTSRSDIPGGLTNGQRAALAHSGVAEACRLRGECETLDADAIRDLLSDLGHLCDREGLDFVQIIRAAKKDWRDER